MGSDRKPTPIELMFQLRNLERRDVLSNTDAFCVIHSIPKNNNENSGSGRSHRKIPEKIPEDGSFEIGRTEVVLDTRNPDFETTVPLEYCFEIEQRFVLRVFDEDVKDSTLLSDHDYMGGFEFTLGELMGSVGNSIARPLGKKKSYAIIQAEKSEVERGESARQERFTFQWSAKNLKNTDGIFGKSDPFYRIYRQSIDAKNWNLVYESDFVKNNLNPVFEEMSLSAYELCNGNHDRPLKIQILDYDSNGSHDDLGSVETTLNDLLRHGENKSSLDLMRMSRKTKQLKKKGTLTIEKAKLDILPSMVDYISGGCEISLSVAVDFTASNGSIDDVNSLHYQGNDQPNQYQSAMRAVGSILYPYDTDGSFPLWGFGAKIDGQHVRHRFPLRRPDPNKNDEEELEDVHSVEEMLQVYSSAFDPDRNLELYGPTNFEFIIMRAMNRTIDIANKKKETGGQYYHVLLIITDGTITDMDNTIDMICAAASDAPMSIVIVGVGDADFGEMEALDGDKSRGWEQCERDIVQFVPFNRFMKGSDSDGDDGSATTTTKKASERLAAETLREIPDQLVKFLFSKGILPNDPLPKPDFNEDDIFVIPFGDDDNVGVAVEIDDGDA